MNRRPFPGLLAGVLAALLFETVGATRFPVRPSADCALCGHACCCPEVCRPLLDKKRVRTDACATEAWCRPKGPAAGDVSSTLDETSELARARPEAPPFPRDALSSPTRPRRAPALKGPPRRPALPPPRNA